MNPLQRQPLLSVLIRAHDDAQVFLRVIEAVRIQQGVARTEFEVILLDETSTQYTSEWLAAHSAEWGERLKVSRGAASDLSSACNEAVRLARGKFLLLLGRGIIATPGLFRRHLDAHSDDPDGRSIVVGAVAWAPDLPKDAFRDWMTEHVPEFAPSRQPSGGEVGPEFFRSWHASLQRSALLRNPFDETLACGYEDLELGQRLRSAGHRFLYDPDAPAILARPFTFPEFLVHEFQRGQSLHGALWRMARLPGDPAPPRFPLWRMAAMGLRCGLQPLARRAGWTTPQRHYWRDRCDFSFCSGYRAARKQVRREKFILTRTSRRRGLALLVRKGGFRSRVHSAPTRPGPGANISGYISGEFGLGEAARGLVRSFDAAGIPYVLNNVEVRLHRSQDRSYTRFSENNPYPVNLIAVNVDRSEEFYANRGPGYFRNRYNIASWFWELSAFPDAWRPRFARYDEIWAASQFSVEALAKVSPVPVIKMTYPVGLDVQEGDAVADRARFGIDDDDFAYLFSFDFASTSERKNPHGLLEAFRRAFPDRSDAVLVLKTVNSRQNPGALDEIRRRSSGLRVQIIDGHFSKADIWSLMASCDCFVSLHRSEGLGLGMAECMYLHKPVIATGYSGNLEFMTNDNSLLVDYRLVELDRKVGPYTEGNVWAEPDLDQAASFMRKLYEDRTLAAAIGSKAGEDIRERMNARRAGAQIADRLRRIEQIRDDRAS